MTSFSGAGLLRPGVKKEISSIGKERTGFQTGIKLIWGGRGRKRG